MKNLKKIVTMLIIAAMSLSVVSCSPGGGESSEGTESSASSAASSSSSASSASTIEYKEGMPLTDEKVELDIWTVRSTQVEDLETNKLTKWYEEQTNVHVNWISIESTDATTAFNLTLASHDYPDIYARRFSTSEIMMCAEDGVLMPLNDLIDEYAPNLKQKWEENPAFVDYMTAPDGNVYTFFDADTGTHLLAENKMFVYKPWLDKLGLDIPQTTEEFKEMLIAFRDQDPNGNGLQDEIPYMSCMGWGGSSPFGYMIDPFELSTDFFREEDGTVVYKRNTDGFRDGLAYMRDLYAEGLITEETFVQDMNQLYAVVAATDESSVLVGCSSGIWQGMFNDNTGVNKQYDYVTIPPLEGPTGLRQTATTCPDGVYTFFQNDCAITNECEYPEIAVQWLDYWLGEEATWIQYYGWEEGVDYEVLDEPSVRGDAQSRRMLFDANPVQNVNWLNTVIPRCDFYDVRFSMTYDPTNIDTLLWEVAQPYNDYLVYTGKPLVSWSSDTEMAERQSNFSTLFGEYTKENEVAFVIGTRDLDIEWEAYCQELEELGLPEYLEIMQEVYNQ